VPWQRPRPQVLKVNQAEQRSTSVGSVEACHAPSKSGRIRVVGAGTIQYWVPAVTACGGKDRSDQLAADSQVRNGGSGHLRHQCPTVPDPLSA